MTQPEFVRSLQSQSMIMQAEEEDTKLNFREQMLVNNHIHGLIPVEIRFFDNKKCYYYDVAGVRSLDEISKGDSFSLLEIKQFLKQLISVILKSKEYFLGENDFILLAEYIFLSNMDSEVKLIYFNGYDKTLQNQFVELLEYLMNHIDYHEEKAVLFIYSLYMKSKESSSTFEELLPMILKPFEGFEDQISHSYCNEENRSFFLSNKKLADEAAKEVQEAQCQDVKPIIVSNESQYRNRRRRIPNESVRKMKDDSIVKFPVNRKDMQKPVDNFRNLNKVSGINKLRYLFKRAKKNSLELKQNMVERYSEKNENEPDLNKTTMLIDFSQKQNASFRGVDSPDLNMFEIKNLPFYIGTMKSHMDYCIPDVTVSRFHAKIEQKDGVYYLTDLCSTNGTYLNGERLGINESRRLTNNDEVAFAKRRYIFTCPID